MISFDFYALLYELYTILILFVCDVYMICIRFFTRFVYDCYAFLICFYAVSAKANEASRTIVNPKEIGFSLEKLNNIDKKFNENAEKIKKIT